MYPYGITKQMEQFIQHNFLLIRDFKEQLHVIRKQDVHVGLAKNILLDHFEDIFTKVIRILLFNDKSACVCNFC